MAHNYELPLFLVKCILMVCMSLFCWLCVAWQHKPHANHLIWFQANYAAYLLVKSLHTHLHLSFQQCPPAPTCACSVLITRVLSAPWLAKVIYKTLLKFSQSILIQAWYIKSRQLWLPYIQHSIITRVLQHFSTLVSKSLLKNLDTRERHNCYYCYSYLTHRKYAVRWIIHLIAS